MEDTGHAVGMGGGIHIVFQNFTHKVCNERTVGHLHLYLVYMPYNVGVSKCSIAHLHIFTGQWPVFRKF